jgi:hypothetical protein
MVAAGMNEAPQLIRRAHCGHYVPIPLAHAIQGADGRPIVLCPDCYAQAGGLVAVDDNDSDFTTQEAVSNGQAQADDRQ